MNIIYSPSGIVDFLHPAQGLADMSNAGLKNISLDISLCCSGYDLEHYGKKYNSKDTRADKEVELIRSPESMRRHFEPFITRCRSHSLSVEFVRVPRLPWDTKCADLNSLLEEIAESAIHLCGSIGCRQIIVPPLFSGIKKGMEWQVNRDYYLRLAETARRYGVTILLENQCRSHNGHLIRGICSDSVEVIRWIDCLNAEADAQSVRLGTEVDKWSAYVYSGTNTNTAPAFAFCLDTGICTLCGQDMQEFTSVLGKRLQAVILRDSGMQQESSLLPFTSAYRGQPQTGWLSLIRGLRTIAFDGSLVLDLADTASSFSPLLRPQLLPLARATAEYFQWQIRIEGLLKKYDSIVLFGAGNMCRNYMKCYGQQYPPLFTCDNNQALWGTEFCGLEVRPPETLKEIPDNCGIFICNIYYREIEKQLREMGIKNIEFFNDEYMPSFHFDRLEVRDR